MAVPANVVYDNKVIGDKFESILSTKVDINQFLTVDRSLTESAGMRKTINTYTPMGAVETLAEGEGNSSEIVCSFVGRDYDVQVRQGKSAYTDEQYMKDPNVLDVLVKGQAEAMINSWTESAFFEMSKTTQGIVCDFSTTTAGYFFGKVADAAALLGESADNYTLLVGPQDVAYIRKQLGEDLKYSEGFARTGYIGSVCGFPVVMMAKIPHGLGILVNKEAVTLFVKKDTEVEQHRDADHRINEMYIRKAAVVALTDARKAVILGSAQATPCAITAAAKTTSVISGTCSTLCHLVIVKDAAGNIYEVTPSAGSWSATTKAALVAGQKVYATAYAPGCAPSEANATVA